MKENIHLHTDWTESISSINKKYLERFFLCKAFSVSQIYRPSENPVIQIICLKPKAPGTLFVFQGNDNIIHEENITFSRNGLALITLESLPIGKYSVRVRIGDLIESLESYFEVQEYKRSLLHAEVDLIKDDGNGKILITLLCKEFTGEIFSGDVKLTLNNIELDAKFQEGKISFSILENRLQSDIFPISLTDGRGNTTELVVKLFGDGLNHNLPLNNFGKRYKITSLKMEEAKEAIGMFIYEEKYEYQDWEIHKKDFNLFSPVINSEDPFIKIEYIGDNNTYSKVEIHTINLLKNTETKEFQFNNPTKGAIFSIPASSPICFFSIRGYLLSPDNEIILANGTVIFSENINLDLESVNVIEPNEKLNIKISSNTDCDIFLLAKPKITKTNYSHEEIQNSYEKFIQQGEYYAGWSLGRKEIKESYIKRKLNKFLDFFESIPPIVFKIILFPVWMVTLLLDLFYFLTTLTSRRRRMNEEELAAQQVLMREAPLRAGGFGMDEMEDLVSQRIGTQIFQNELDLEAKLNKEIEQSYPEIKEKIRTVNQSVIHTSVHEIEKEAMIEINGIQDTGLLELYVFAVRGFHFTYIKKEILSKKETYTISEFPPLISKIKGASEAFIQTITKEKELDLIVSQEKILFEEKTFPKQNHTLTLLDAGNYIVDLQRDKTLLDRFETNTSWIYESKILKSKLHTLKKGDSISGEKLWVYPGYTNLTIDMVKSLYEYPHGCAEQTLSGLFGNGMLFLKMESGEIAETKEFNRSNLKKRILFGQEKIKILINLYFSNYLWGLFDESSISLSITAQCLLHLRPFYKTKISNLFPKLETIAIKTMEKLLEQKYTDNRLLSFNTKFKEEKIDSPESAASLILNSIDKNEALEYLNLSKKENGIGIFWEGKSLAGKLQTTILVAQALYTLNSPLFSRAWLWICRQLEGNRFYSTSDTAEFLTLLFYLKKIENFSALVDKVKLENKSLTQVIPAKEIQVLEGELLVKEDWIETLNYNNLTSNLSVFIKNLPAEIKFLSELKLEIEVEEKNSTCLVARVSTSGKLVSPSGSTQAVTIELPLKKGKALFTLQAIAKGICEIQVIVYDLYNPELIGISLKNTVTIL